MKNKAQPIYLLFISTLLASTSFVSIANENESDVMVEATANNSCGIVSVYQKPPESKNIYFVNINKIDNIVVPDKGAQFQLSPGTHKIKVIEQISDSYFTRRRGSMKNYKDFEIVIEPNKKYYLGAQYIRKNRSKLKTGEYWEPIVWKTSDAECTM
ncbi:hypothetical protein [Thalassotalea litorea]|uniref:hypothetical protein n=1 Tax=Thalassotalea litorea TaxID=2020715 RepID=UPI0037366929